MSFEYTHRIPIVLNNILTFLIILELTNVLLQLGIFKQVGLVLVDILSCRYWAVRKPLTQHIRQ